MDWSTSLVLEFIELYKQQRVIWDFEHRDNKNRAMLTRAWETIQAQLSTQVSIDTLKRKKECLMSTYRVLLRKYREAEAAGSAYRPTWFAFDALYEFIQTKQNYLPSIGQMEDSFGNSQIIFTDEEKSDREDEDQAIEADDADDFKLLLINTEEPEVSSHEPPRKKRNRKRASLEPSKPAMGIHQVQVESCDPLLESSRELAAFPKRAEPADECTFYGQLLAIKLRALDRRSRIILKNKIDNLVFEAELQSLDQNRDLSSTDADALTQNDISYL